MSKLTKRRALLSLGFLATTAGLLSVVLAVPLAGMPRPHAASATVVTPFELDLDCNTTLAGIQSSCVKPTGTTAVDIAVVLKNNSGSASDLGSFNFNVVTNQQTIFNPGPTNADTFNSNPDFNEAAVT